MRENQIVNRKTLIKGMVLKHVICCVLIYIITLSGCIGYCKSDQKVISEKNVAYSELLFIATNWKDCLLNMDIDTIASYSLPEERDKIKIDLRNKESFLYRFLYDDKWNQKRGSKSIYRTLKSAKRLKIFLLEHKNLKKYGNGVTAYFYDEDKVNPKFPLNDTEEQFLINKGDIWSTFFFQVEGNWYTSYNFFEE